MIVNKILNTSKIFLWQSFKQIKPIYKTAYSNFFKKTADKRQVQTINKKQMDNQFWIKQMILNNQQPQTQTKASLMHNLTIIIANLNKQIYFKHKQIFQSIHYKIIQNSQQLNLLPHQLLVIILAYDLLQNISPIQLTKNFNKKLTMMATHFLKEKLLSLTQAIAIYQSFNNTKNTLTLSFLIHFNTFLKYSLTKPNQQIYLDELITIFNIFFKNNYHNMLQYIMINQTFKYLVDHLQLLHQTTITQQIQLLSSFIALDFTRFYLTQEQEGIGLIIKIMHKIKSSLLLQYKKNLSLWMKYMVSILDLFKNIQIIQSRNHKIFTFFDQIENLIISFFIQNRLQSISIVQNYVHLIIPLLFNSQTLICKFQQNNQEVFIEFLDLIYKNSKKSIFYNEILAFYKNGNDAKSETIRNRIQQILKNMHLMLTQSNIINYELLDIFMSLSNPQQIISHILHLNAILKLQKDQQEQEEHFITIAILMYMHNKDINILLNQNNNQSQLINKAFINSFFCKNHLNKIKVLKIINKIISFQNDQECIKRLMRMVSNNIDLHHFSGQLRLQMGNSKKYSWNLINLLVYYTYYIGSSSQSQKTLTQLLIKDQGQQAYSYLISLFPQVNYHNRQLENHSYFLSFGDLNRKMKFIVNKIKFNKFSYLIWDLLIKYYTKRSVDQRENCKNLVKQLFIQMYERQASRKVVALTNLSTLLAQKIIIDRQGQLTSLIIKFIPALLSSSSDFHYYCWLQIFFNLHALNSLQLGISHLIIKAFMLSMQSSITKSSLYNFYAIIINNHMKKNKIKHLEEMPTYDLQTQYRYIDKLLNKRFIKVNLIVNQYKNNSSGREFEYLAGNKFLCILLQSGRQIAWLSSQILLFIEDCSFRQLMQLSNSIRGKQPQSQDMKVFLTSLKRSINKRLQQSYNKSIINGEQLKEYQLHQDGNISIL